MDRGERQPMGLAEYFWVFCLVVGLAGACISIGYIASVLANG